MRPGPAPATAAAPPRHARRPVTATTTGSDRSADDHRAARCSSSPRNPCPGGSKTRLTPPYTPEEAAALAEAALADTLDAVLGQPARRRVLVLDGAPGPWLPHGFEVVPQCAGGLDERLAAAFAAAATGPALLIGMDTPQVTPELLARGWSSTAGATPGSVPPTTAASGRWAWRSRIPELLRGVPMSDARHRRRTAAPAGRRGAARCVNCPCCGTWTPPTTPRRSRPRPRGSRFAAALSPAAAAGADEHGGTR